MLDVVLPPVIAVLGAVIAALPLYAAKRGARVPSGLRIAGVFLAIWGGRCLAYALVAHPLAVVRMLGGVAALGAGVWVFSLTFRKRTVGREALGPAILGLTQLGLTIADVLGG